MKKRIITGLVIISVATASLMAFGPNHRGKGSGHKPSIIKALKQLDLSDEQKASLKELRTDMKANREAFREEKMKTSVIINTIFTEQGFDKVAFIDNSTQRFQKRVAFRADFMEKAYAILDETQKVEFVQNMQEMRDKKAE